MCIFWQPCRHFLAFLHFARSMTMTIFLSGIPCRASLFDTGGQQRCPLSTSTSFPSCVRSFDFPLRSVWGHYSLMRITCYFLQQTGHWPRRQHPISKTFCGKVIYSSYLVNFTCLLVNNYNHRLFRLIVNNLGIYLQGGIYYPFQVIKTTF